MRAPPCHSAHVMRAARWIEHQVSCRQLDVVHAVRVFHYEFTAIVLVRLGEEQRC